MATHKEHLNPTRILLVEDSPTQALRSKMILEAQGYSIIQAGNGIEALKQARREKPDLILSDVLMPEMDGLQLAYEIQKDTVLQAIPFIMHTATYIRQEDREFGLDTGADAYIAKDSPPMELFALIEKVISEKRSGQMPESQVKNSSKKGSFEEVHKQRMLFRLLEETAALEQANRVLKEVEIRFTQIAENVGEWIWEVDAQGLYTYASPVVEKILGYSPEEIVGKKHFYDLFAPEVRAGLKEDAFAAFARKESFKNFENQNIHKDGQVVILEKNGSPVLDESGNVLGYRGADNDITARNQAEVALKEKVEDLHRMATVVSDSNDAIILHDFDGKILAWNRGAKETYGYSEAESLGKNVREIVAEPDREAALNLIERIKHGEVVKSFELRRVTKDGRILDVWLTTTLLRDETGKPVAIATTERDITERKQVEAEQTARETADRANAAKSEFLSRMSHELRTPMNSILGFAQLLTLSKKEPLTPGQHERVEQILNAGKILLEIINEVLDLSRIEADRMTISPEPIRVQAILEEVVELINPLGAERQIKIILTDISPTLYIKADNQRLKQVLLNLLSNAIKYNNEDGSVTISCESQSEGWLRTNIKDTGNGISEHEIKRLFIPFERLSKYSNKIEGTGLGLALTKRLIELMGGQIGVESKVGKGSTFWFDLPMTKPQKELATYKTEKSVTPTVTNLPPQSTILYIEDNLANYELVKQIADEQLGIKLLWAMRGSIGLHLAKQHHPDLILLDLNLPDIHGADLLKRFQHIKAIRNIPVIILSADATPGQIDRLLHTGASAYLTKPLDVNEFIQAIDKYMKREPNL